MRNRIRVPLLLAAGLALCVSLPAHAVTLSNVTADWPEELLNFQSGFVPANTFQVNSGAGTQLIWFGPGQSANDGSSLTFKKRATLPLFIPTDPMGMSAPFVIGSIQYKNFPVTTKGPIDLVLELTLSFSDLAATPTIQIPFEIDHTNDDVLDIGSCPAGSSTICDDVVALSGNTQIQVADGAFKMTILGFDRSPMDPEDNEAVTSFLGPEGQTGAQIDLLVKIDMIPEPSTFALMGLGMAGLWLGRRRGRRGELPR